MRTNSFTALKTILLAGGLILSSALAQAKEVTAMLRVPAMDCEACTIVIKHALTQTKGVKTVDLNVEKRTAHIVYDDTQVTQPQIEKAIEKAGFRTEHDK